MESLLHSYYREEIGREKRNTERKRTEAHEEEEKNELCYTGRVINRMCKTTITHISHQDETKSLGDRSCVHPSITGSSLLLSQVRV